MLSKRNELSLLVAERMLWPRNYVGLNPNIFCNLKQSLGVRKYNIKQALLCWWTQSAFKSFCSACELNITGAVMTIQAIQLAEGLTSYIIEIEYIIEIIWWQQHLDVNTWLENQESKIHHSQQTNCYSIKLLHFVSVKLQSAKIMSVNLDTAALALP